MQYTVKILIILLIIICHTTNSYSQRWKLKRYRIGIGFASANYFGDVGGSVDKNNLYGLKDIDIKTTQVGYTTSLLYKLQEKIDVKFNFTSTRISASDANGKFPDRKGYFVTKINEPGLQVNYIFFMQENKGGSGKLFSRKGMLNNFSKFNLHVFGSTGMVFFNPLEVLPVARRATGFKQSSIIGSMGLGLVYVLSNKVEFVLDFGGRFTLTDYLDGFVTPASESQDIYYLTTFSFNYRIKTDRRGRPQFDLFK